jgi:hypothetical protein
MMRCNTTGEYIPLRENMDKGEYRRKYKTSYNVPADRVSGNEPEDLEVYRFVIGGMGGK